MGKKRSNHKKRKARIKNLLENSCDEMKDTVFDSKLDEEKNKCKIYFPSEDQNKQINPQQINNNQSSSFKLNPHVPKANPKVFETVNSSSDIRPLASGPYDNLNNSFDSNVYVESYIFVNQKLSEAHSSFSCKSEDKVSLTAEVFNAESTIYKNPIRENYKSEEENLTSDFFQPVYDKRQYNIDSKQISRSETPVNFGRDISSSEASCSNINPREKSYSENKLLEKTLSCSVDAYKSCKDSFSDIYHTWLPERRNTLQKLKELISEVHKNQLEYNKMQAGYREFDYETRRAKLAMNPVVNFVASFAAFLGDAASGITSFAQAYNLDSYQNKFQEIMEKDAEITKLLYEARSQCVEEYHNIEEVMRKFHSDTFSSAVGKISNSLEVDKYWEAMKKAYRMDDMPKLVDVVSQFFNNALKPSKLQEVRSSFQSYVDDNPAALDTCKSAGKATYDYLDTWTSGYNRNYTLRGIKSTANLMLMEEDRREASRLKNAIVEDLPQSKLESQIEDAIDSLECELEEINNIYFELFKNFVDSDDESDCDIYEFY